jgi:hypothetical protein
LREALMLDPIPDTIALTAAERVRFDHLELIVETHLEAF